MPIELPPGGASVSRRAIADVVRAATLGSYGVTGFATSPIDRLLGWLGITHPGIGIGIGDDGIELEIDIDIAYGLPVAEVARQVDSAVRYAMRRALGRDIAALRIRVDGLVVRPAAQPAAPEADRGTRGSRGRSSKATRPSAGQPPRQRTRTTAPPADADDAA